MVSVSPLSMIISACVRMDSAAGIVSCWIYALVHHVIITGRVLAWTDHIYVSVRLDILATDAILDYLVSELFNVTRNSY